MSDDTKDLDKAIELFTEATRESDPLVRDGQMLHGLRCLAMSFRASPPAQPQPATGEEKGGEGVSDLLYAYHRCDEPGEVLVVKAYDLGRHHQASADAATIAGLREKVDAWEPVVRAAIRKVQAWGDGSSNGSAELTAAVDALPASLRPDRKPEP